MGLKITVRSSGTKIFAVEETIFEDGFLAEIFFFFLARVDIVDGGAFTVEKNVRMGVAIKSLIFNKRHFFRNLSHEKRTRFIELNHHETLRREILAVSELQMLFGFKGVCLGLAQKLEPAFDPRKQIQRRLMGFSY